MSALKPLLPQDHARWDEFVRACPEASFFHLAGWKRVIEEAFGHRTHFHYVEEAGQITGVLPLAEVKSRLFGHSLVSLPFCVYGGIAASNSGAAEILTDAATNLAIERGVGHLELRHRAVRHPDWPRQDLYVTFRKPLLPTADENLAAIPRKQRAMVRKGIKNGLVSTPDGGLETFFALYADNVHRHGTPALPKRYFSLLKECFGNDCSVLNVFDSAGMAVSGVLSFRFRDEILPYYAGDCPEARALAANDFKYWELMRRAGDEGVAVFDYGRSKRGTGSFDFKRNWGFEPQPLSYEYALITAKAVPNNNPLNPKYRLFIEAWRRLPRGVANRLGPLLVRSLG